MTKIENAKEEFVSIYKQKIKREGADDLLQWLEESDFFTAPASTKYHLAEAGGLCLHSIHVYDRLKQLLDCEYGLDVPYSEESIAIVALFHDLCKVNFYEASWKNQKTYDPEKVSAADRWQIKHDAAGDFIWETVPTYQIKEDFVFGHGEKSVFIVNQYIDLFGFEAQAIRFHMSSWVEGDTKNVGACYEKNSLAFFLHVADEAATFIDENEE